MASAPPARLRSVERISVPVLDLGQTNACTGFACSNLVNYLLARAGRSVVLSGDTCFNENLIRFSRGADLLVHEVAATSETALRNSPQLRAIMANHTSPEQAGEVFARLGPKLGVYTHVLLFGGAAVEDIVARTRKTCGGALEVGEDLMTIEVGEPVRVRRFGR